MVYYNICILLYHSLMFTPVFIWHIWTFKSAFTTFNFLSLAYWVTVQGSRPTITVLQWLSRVNVQIWFQTYYNYMEYNYLLSNTV